MWIFKCNGIQVIAEHLSGDEVAGIKEAFDMMDTNKRNKINLEELRVGLAKLGHSIPDPDLEILMEAVSNICVFQYILLPYVLSLFCHITANDMP